ncbi:Histidine kinase [Glycomyces harbinensis]|uniref:histidine kinase n=1 Tax=Glycomyces harbinensis TaxID=58114 RepID=A0A1G6RH04_9ACTN|nr:Histidine kinase [Glycomyces harbinensis]
MTAALAGVAFTFAMHWLEQLGTVEISGWAMFDAGELAVIAAATATGILIGWAKAPLPLVAAGAGTALLASTLLGQWTRSDPVLGFLLGVAYTSCLLLAILAVAVPRARRSHVRRGWDLAFAEAREHEVRVEQAVTREREAMAGEIHDGLGHRLTLIAVQASRLSLDETLPDRARAELQRIRENAAAASEELGETVALLSERQSGATASLSGLGIGDVIERARASGVTVHGTIAPEAADRTNDHTHAALMRALQEGLTNAAKHAPGAAVHLAIDFVGDEVVLEMRNATSPVPPSGRGGHGIVALRHRIEILGGTLDVASNEDFTVTVRLPRAAVPSTTAADFGPSRLHVLTEEAADAERRRRRVNRQTWLAPLGVLAVLVLVATGYSVYNSVASVLPPERFAAIEVGDSRSETERLLPPTDMPDSPSPALPEPPGATCHFYEASVSFAERVDVYRICFADDRVVAADTIPSDG